MYLPETILLFTTNNKVLHHIPIGRETKEYVQSKIDLYLMEIGERGVLNPDNIVCYIQYKSKKQ